MSILRLRSNPRNVALIEDFVKFVCKKYKVKSEQYGDILISLTEAVNNAIIHGNQNDESKEVHIQHSTAPNCIAFKVSDEGRGFDYTSLPDPTCPENIHTCGGRGVFLMQRLCDQIEFYDNGSTVEMRFKI